MDYAMWLEKGQSLTLEFVPKLIAALAIFIIGRIAVGVLTRMIRKMLERINADQMLVRFIGNIAYTLMLMMVLLVAVGQLGVQTTSLIAMLGAAGLAIGLAMQDSLSNLAAGIMLVIFRPYRVGDYVEAAGVAGSVEGVQMFTTVLNTPDNRKVIVPNGQIVKSTITNFSAHETRRIDMVFGASYDDNMAQVKEVLEGLVAADSRILSEPAAQIYVHQLGASSVDFGVRVWVATKDFWPTKWAYTEAVKRRFDEAGLSIPFPQQDNHIHQVVTKDKAA